MITALLIIAFLVIMTPFVVWVLINFNFNKLGADFPKWKTIGIVFVVCIVVFALLVTGVALLA